MASPLPDSVIVPPAIPRVEPPYGTIVQELRSGMAIPFLGAAASRVGMQPGDPAYLPSGKDLAEILASDSRFPSQDERDRGDLGKVSSYYVGGSTRGALRRKLRGVFVNEAYRFNELHRLIAQLANNLFIVTTNYDTLLEQAFQAQGKKYDLVVYPADNEEYANAVQWWPHGADEPEKVKSNQFEMESLAGTNVIYKIHGSVRPDAGTWDGFVITEEDYIRFLSRMDNVVPSSIRSYFAERAFLFLGYALNDWNMRVLLNEVSVPGITSWAILNNPSLFEETLWKRRKVDIFHVELEDFVATMRAQAGLL
jgi:hypothetical protein